MACYADGKRKLWNEERMEAATIGVQSENIREALKLYNVPFETLRRRVIQKMCYYSLRIMIE